MKTIVYEYLFNYFGGVSFKGNIVAGASVLLAIRPYRKGNQVEVEREEDFYINGYYLNSVFDVSFDKKNVFQIKRNLVVDNLFRLTYCFDTIQAETVGFSFDIIRGSTEIVLPELAKISPKELKKFPVRESIQVSEKDFRDFIIGHVDDFDISDNKKAQCPSIDFMEDYSVENKE